MPVVVLSNKVSFSVNFSTPAASLDFHSEGGKSHNSRTVEATGLLLLHGDGRVVLGVLLAFPVEATGLPVSV